MIFGNFLVSSTGILAAFLQKILKIVRTLRVNETKVTSRNVLIDKRFALKNEKE